MRQKGISLVIAAGISIVVLLLTMVSLAMVNANSRLTRSLYAQSITLNGAESGIHSSTQVILDDAENGFSTLLENQAFPIHSGNIQYSLFGSVDFEVEIRDNDDLDDDLSEDVDKRFILTAESTLPDGGRAQIELLAEYIGTADEYAQETGTSKSHSHYSGEINMSDF